MTLLVIDTQKGITDSRIPFFEEFVSNVKTLIQTARDQGIEVIYFQHDDGPDSGFTFGDEDFEIYEEFAPLEGEKIYVKEVCSAFSNEAFKKHLEEKGEDTIIVAGLMTNYCINATILSGFDLGYSMVVPDKANATFDNDYMDAMTTYRYYNEEIWPNRFATCIPMEQTLAFMTEPWPREVCLLQYFKDLFHKNDYELDSRFILKDGKKHKCAILCPGGGYGMVCSYVEGVPFAKYLNEKGISAVIVYYRVREKACFPNPQDDLARAVKETFAHAEEWNLDMSDYSVWGCSAGGHLASSFGLKEIGYAHYGLPKPNALVLVYPVISMTKELTHAETREHLLGTNPSLDMIEKCSAELASDADYPRTFIWAGLSDELVPYQNTEVMAKHLVELGVEHEVTLYPEVGHGVGLAGGTNAEDWIEKAVKFWLS